MKQGLLSLLLIAAAAHALSAQSYDVVILNGRVIDPETKLDAVRNVGIKDGLIASISKKPLTGKRVIDATGHIVSPGFIVAYRRSDLVESVHDGSFFSEYPNSGCSCPRRWW